jgi:hypothetical protein
MILVEENESTWRKPCPSATLFTTNPTWTGIGLNSGLYSQIHSIPKIIQHRWKTNKIQVYNIGEIILTRGYHTQWERDD